MTQVLYYFLVEVYHHNENNIVNMALLDPQNVIF